jgi:carbon monoxide dehydrogenase subunit G
MNDTPASPAPPPPRRIRKRIGIPMAFIGVITALLLWGIVRGNWTDREIHDPSSAADGAVSQLIATAEGRKQVRAAIIVNAAPDRVWKVVTDYDRFSDVFPNISTSKGVRDPDGRWHVTGEVRSLVGSWPMDLHVQHQESNGKSVASWDEPHGAWKVNRGSWVVTEDGPGETLLQYNLEIKVSPFPDFIVRAILLEELKPVMRAVANRAERNQPPR